MENIRKIAQAVKDHLISLAIEDSLPLDMNELKVSDIEDIILAKTMNIITVVKPQARKICYWSGADVKTKVDELNEDGEYNIDCTDGFIDAVLDVVEDRFDANYGTTWEDIEEAIIDVWEVGRI
tara:strand:+ start:498 stop:869 length:372 start_codon:yes stop_codon:yes gene_type:complete